MKFSFLTIIFLLSACSTHENWISSKKDITIMTYNVQNLFDTTHDNNKNDYAYLPKEVKQKNPRYMAQCHSISKRSWRNACLNDNWTPEVLRKKMERLADVILKVKNGNGPDILLLQEVENLSVLEMLRTNHLTHGRYQKSILIEGPDKRGIDTALITRLPVIGIPKLHKLNFQSIGVLHGRKKRPTRGILEVTLALPNNDLLTILVAHFPSQGGPTELRRQALAILQAIIKKLPRNRMIIAGGDLNITDTEDRKHNLLDTYIASDFYISHRIGLFNEKGTQSYRNHWSFLDMLLFSKNMHPNYGDSSWQFIPESLRVPKHSTYQVTRFSTPKRFNVKSLDGVSDHYPVVVDLTLRKNNI